MTKYFGGEGCGDECVGGISAARFDNLSPFGLLFEPFGDQYFALATWQFGFFLGDFLK